MYAYSFGLLELLGHMVILRCFCSAWKCPYVWMHFKKKSLFSWILHSGGILVNTLAMAPRNIMYLLRSVILNSFSCWMHSCFPACFLACRAVCFVLLSFTHTGVCAGELLALSVTSRYFHCCSTIDSVAFNLRYSIVVSFYCYLSLF